MEDQELSDHPTDVPKKWLFRILGSLFLVVGIAGLVLPVLPGAIFLIVSAACFARGSKKIYNWLVSHKWLGSYVKDFHEGKGIPLKAKVVATLSVLVPTIINLIIFKVLWIKLFVIVMSVIILAYVWHQPTRK